MSTKAASATVANIAHLMAALTHVSFAAATRELPGIEPARGNTLNWKEARPYDA